MPELQIGIAARLDASCDDHGHEDEGAEAGKTDSPAAEPSSEVRSWLRFHGSGVVVAHGG